MGLLFLRGVATDGTAEFLITPDLKNISEISLLSLDIC